MQLENAYKPYQTSCVSQTMQSKPGTGMTYIWFEDSNHTCGHLSQHQVRLHSLQNTVNRPTLSTLKGQAPKSLAIDVGVVEQEGGMRKD